MKFHLDYRFGHILGFFVALGQLIRKPRSLYRIMVYFPTQSHFHGRDAAFTGLTVEQILGEAPRPVRIGAIGYGIGSTSIFETTVLGAMVAAARPRTILEIGTFRGKTTQALFWNAPDDATVYTVDLPDSGGDTAHITDTVLTRNKARPYLPNDPRIVQILCDSKQLDLSKLPPIDFAFIDGSHSYEYARADTQLILKHLSPTGVIVWHDAGKPGFVSGYGVRKALAQLARQVPIYRVLGSSLAFYSRHPDLPARPSAPAGEVATDVQRYSADFFNIHDRE